MKKRLIELPLDLPHRVMLITATFSAVGVILLLLVKAAPISFVIEPENSIISGKAATENSIAASGGKYVKFNSQSSNVLFSNAIGRTIPDTLYGTTIESVENLSLINDSLARHNQRPITRIVFQRGNKPTDYASSVDILRDTSYLMGELLDSSSMRGMSVADYTTRARDYISTFGKKIDIWEIGNELNGEWLGTPTEIRAKVQAAYDVAANENANLNLKTAITLNYWPSSDCYSNSWEDTLSFAQSLSNSIKNGVNYVLLSFYETACSPRAKPTDAQFISIFDQLKTIFPNSKIGMGEIGAQGTSDGLPSDPTFTEKQQIANRYYSMHRALKDALGPRYVGGYFWWYYFQDAVPYNKDNSLWQTIENLFNTY